MIGYVYRVPPGSSTDSVFIFAIMVDLNVICIPGDCAGAQDKNVGSMSKSP